jgi:hypothetical protein
MIISAENIEERRLRSLFELVEAVENVVKTLPEDDGGRARLLALSNRALAGEGAMCSVIAARLLRLSDKTVRAWAAVSVLTVARRSPRLLLDSRSVYAAWRLVSEMRAAGQERNLLGQVRHRLKDAVPLDHDELHDN